MRKRLVTPTPRAGTHGDEGWLDLDRETVVEGTLVEGTLEDKDYPAEAALSRLTAAR
jgi:hypothetical protein